MSKVIFTNKAKSDLRLIALYIARDNIGRAKFISKELRTACQKLGEHLLLFAKVDGYADLRKRVYGNYLIFYRVKNDYIEVLHVLHGSIDIDTEEMFQSNREQI